jgi:hypothetical protein
VGSEAERVLRRIREAKGQQTSPGWGETFFPILGGALAFGGGHLGTKARKARQEKEEKEEPKEKKAAMLPSYLRASKNPMLPRFAEAARETAPRKTYDFSGAVSKLVRQMQRPTQQATRSIPMPGPIKRSA